MNARKCRFVIFSIATLAFSAALPLPLHARDNTSQKPAGISAADTRPAASAPDAQAVQEEAARAFQQKDFKTAETLFDKAARLFEQSPDTQSQYAHCLFWLASTLRELNRPDDALETFVQSYKACKDLGDSKNLRGVCLAQVANMTLLLGRHEESARASIAAAQILAEVPGQEVYTANCLHNACNAFLETHEYSNALVAAEAAVKVFRILPGQEDGLADALYNWGRALNELGRYEEGLNGAREALGLLTRLPGTEQRQIWCIQNIIWSLARLGRFEEGLRAVDEGMSLCKRALPETAEEYGECIECAGLVLSEAGRFTESIQKYEEALVFYERLPDSDLKRAQCLGNASTSLYKLAQFAKAETMLTEALQLYEKHPGTECDRARCLFNLSNTQVDGGRAESAYSSCLEALRLYRAIPDTEREQGECLTKLGSLLCVLKRYDEALSNCDAALAILKPLPGTELAQAHAVQDAALALRLQGRCGEALERCEDALKRFQALPASEANQASVWCCKGHALAQLGRFEDAASAYARGEKIGWDYYVVNFPMMTEEQKESLSEAVLVNPDCIYTLVLRDVPPSPATATNAFDTVLQRNALMNDLLRRERVELSKDLDDPKCRGLYERLQQLRREYASLVLSNHQAQDIASVNIPESVIAERLAALQPLIQEAEESLVAVGGRLSEGKMHKRISIPEIADVLTERYPGAALIQYICYTQMDFSEASDETGPTGKEELDDFMERRHYAAFVLRAGDSKPAAIDLGSAGPIEDALLEFRTNVETVCSGAVLPAPEEYADSETACRQLGETVRKLLFDPLLPHLKDSMRIFVAPYQVLSWLPFEALPDPTPAIPGGYLAERYAFSYLNGSRELVEFPPPGRTGEENGRAVIVAGPDYDVSADQQCRILNLMVESSSTRNTPSYADHLAPTLMSLSTKPGLKSFSEIPRAQEFTRDLAGQFDVFGLRTTVLDREKALEHTVQDLKAPRILQFLTHGAYLWDAYDKDAANAKPEAANPLLYSVVALTGANTHHAPYYARRNQTAANSTTAEYVPWDQIPEAERAVAEKMFLDDGLLTAYEVSGMNLVGTELVVLTACESGIGLFQRGRSVAGLRYAFSLAGAESVIASQWSVKTEESLSQIEDFYGIWLGKQKGRDRYGAFRKAQLNALNKARSAEESRCGHPWLWAGFVYVGNPAE